MKCNIYSITAFNSSNVPSNILVSVTVSKLVYPGLTSSIEYDLEVTSSV